MKLIYFFIFLLFASIITGTMSLYYYESIKGFHEFVKEQRFSLWASRYPDEYTIALNNDFHNMKYYYPMRNIFLSSVFLFIFSALSILILKSDLEEVRINAREFKRRFIPQ